MDKDVAAFIEKWGVDGIYWEIGADPDHADPVMAADLTALFAKCERETREVTWNEAVAVTCSYCKKGLPFDATAPNQHILEADEARVWCRAADLRQAAAIRKGGA